MFKKLSLISAVFALTFIAQTANAQEKVTESKYALKSYAVVDVKYIVDESKAAKTAEKEVKSIQDKYVKQAEAEEKKLKKREGQLLNQKKALSQEAFVKKVEEFQKKIVDGRKKTLKKRKILEAAFIKSLELVRDETLKVIKEIAEKKNIDVVYPKSQLLYFQEEKNITKEVLKMLNSRLSKVNINIEKSKKKK